MTTLTTLSTDQFLYDSQRRWFILQEALPYPQMLRCAEKGFRMQSARTDFMIHIGPGRLVTGLEWSLQQMDPMPAMFPYAMRTRPFMWNLLYEETDKSVWHIEVYMA